MADGLPADRNLLAVVADSTVWQSGQNQCPESSDSRPPTGQAHFFRPGSETRVVRGSVDIAPDPHALEIDLDYDHSEGASGD